MARRTPSGASNSQKPNRLGTPVLGSRTRFQERAGPQISRRRRTRGSSIRVGILPTYTVVLWGWSAGAEGGAPAGVGPPADDSAVSVQVGDGSARGRRGRGASHVSEPADGRRRYALGPRDAASGVRARLRTTIRPRLRDAMSRKQTENRSSEPCPHTRVREYLFYNYAPRRGVAIARWQACSARSRASAASPPRCGPSGPRRPRRPSGTTPWITPRTAGPTVGSRMKIVSSPTCTASTTHS